MKHTLYPKKEIAPGLYAYKLICRFEEGGQPMHENYEMAAKPVFCPRPRCAVELDETNCEDLSNG